MSDSRRDNAILIPTPRQVTLFGLFMIVAMTYIYLVEHSIYGGYQSDVNI